MDTFTIIWLAFLAGIYAPIGAPCAIVLYPGYIAFLAGRAGRGGLRSSPFVLGIVIGAGVILAMLAGGLIFSLAVQMGGSAVRDIVTPLSFIVLFLLAIALIFDISVARVPYARQFPGMERPHCAALVFGISFGFIILPCNAAAVALLIALASTTSGLAEGLGAFLAFSLGITVPLLVLAGLSQAMQRKVTAFLSRYQKQIRVISGMVMLLISIYYLTLLFQPLRIL